MDERVRNPSRRYEQKHTETGTEARQATLDRPILYVLIGGLILGAIYVIGTQIWNANADLSAETPVTETSATVPTSNTAAGAPAAQTPTPAAVSP